MRAKKSIRNIKYNLIILLLTMILAFILRKIFLMYLGIDNLGLKDILGHLIGYLSLFGAGISAVSSHKLYYPIQKSNKKKIIIIFWSIDRIYKKLFFIITTLGILASPLLIFIIKEKINIYLIIIYWLFYVINASLTILLLKYKTFLLANQQAYIDYIISGSARVLTLILQIATIYLFKSFLLFIIIETIFFIYQHYLFNKYIKSEFTYLEKNKTKKNIKIKNLKYVLIHYFSGHIVWQVDYIIISIFLGVSTVAIYGGYVLIIGSLYAVTTAILGSLTGSIGNFLSEKKPEEIYKLWKELVSFNYLFAGIISYCFYKLSNPFVTIWLGDDYTINNNIIIILSFNLFIKISKSITEQFKYANGIFQDIHNPIAEMGINLLTSIILTHYYGLIGAVIGTAISNIIIVAFSSPIYYFKNSLKLEAFLYLKPIFKYFFLIFLCIILLEYGIDNFIPKVNLTVLGWLYYATIVFILSCFIFGIIFLLCQDIRVFLKRIISYFLK